MSKKVVNFRFDPDKTIKELDELSVMLREELNMDLNRTQVIEYLVSIKHKQLKKKRKVKV